MRSVRKLSSRDKRPKGYRHLVNEDRPCPRESHDTNGCLPYIKVILIENYSATYYSEVVLNWILAKLNSYINHNQHMYLVHNRMISGECLCQSRIPNGFLKQAFQILDFSSQQRPYIKANFEIKPAIFVKTLLHRDTEL